MTSWLSFSKPGKRPGRYLYTAICGCDARQGVANDLANETDYKGHIRNPSFDVKGHCDLLKERNLARVRKRVFMTRKQRRTTVIVSGVSVAIAATLLILTALRDSIVYFHSPSEVVSSEMVPGENIRIGGLVSTDSVKRGGGETIFFSVTDMAATVPVEFTGILPDLFREGQGVVIEGAFDSQEKFIAKTVLAKHDENYMPPEVADALKEAGHWEEYEGGTMDTSKGPRTSLPPSSDGEGSN
jgi:cytochrome c-type biogenesis protein CcmE